MLRQRSCSLLMLLCALVTIGTVPSPGFAGKDGTSRPFKGRAQGTITSFQPPNIQVEYTGNATHLGRFTRTEHATLGDNGTISGTIDFTAANGDQLHVSFTGAFVSPTDIDGSYTIEGGSGRFVNATGTATFQASTDNESVEVTFEGTISY